MANYRSRYQGTGKRERKPYGPRSISDAQATDLYDEYKKGYKYAQARQDGKARMPQKSKAQFLTDLISARAHSPTLSSRRLARELGRDTAYFFSERQGLLYGKIYEQKEGDMTRRQFANKYARGLISEETYEDVIKSSLREMYSEFREDYIKQHPDYKRTRAKKGQEGGGGIGGAWKIALHQMLYGE